MTLVSELGIMPSTQELNTSLGSQKLFQVPTPVLQTKKDVVAFFGAGVECIGEIWDLRGIHLGGLTC